MSSKFEITKFTRNQDIKSESVEKTNNRIKAPNYVQMTQQQDMGNKSSMLKIFLKEKMTRRHEIGMILYQKENIFSNIFHIEKITKYNLQKLKMQSWKSQWIS